MVVATSLCRVQHPTVTPEALDRLVGLQTGGRPVLSLYMSLDPTVAPHLADRRTELDSLLLEASARARDSGEPGVAREIKRVGRLLGDERLAVDGARGLAVFSCETGHFFELLTLPVGVAPAAYLDERPVVGPLVGMVRSERWCALLVSSRASRVLLGDRESLTEVEDMLDDVHRRHSQGGWSQSRYQRGIEKEIDEHIGQTCELLFERHRRTPLDHLVLGCPLELRPRVERHLHPDLHARLVGHFEIDVERATPEQAYTRVLPLIEELERARERAALDRLREGIAPGGHASVGLDETLEALEEERVGTLLVARDFAAPGFICPRCGHLAARGGRCTIDGAPMRAQQNIVERAIERAVAHALEVLVVHSHVEELQRAGSIAALLRY